MHKICLSGYIIPKNKVFGCICRHLYNICDALALQGQREMVGISDNNEDGAQDGVREQM